MIPEIADYMLDAGGMPQLSASCPRIIRSPAILKAFTDRCLSRHEFHIRCPIERVPADKSLKGDDLVNFRLPCQAEISGVPILCHVT